MNDGGYDALVVFLFASAGVMGLTYLATRMLGRIQAVRMKGRRIKVLEGMALGKDQHLSLVAVGDDVLLVGSSPGGVTLVREMPREQALRMLEDVESQPQAPQLWNPELDSRVSQYLEKLQSLGTRKGDHHGAG